VRFQIGEGRSVTARDDEYVAWKEGAMVEERHARIVVEHDVGWRSSRDDGAKEAPHDSPGA
jgi:hypothetical protein